MPGWAPDPAGVASRRQPPRQPAFWLLAAGVLAAHLLLASEVADERLGWGQGDGPPPRIEVAFVRELAPAAPPPPPAAAAATPPAAHLPAVSEATPPAAPASAPQAAATAPAPAEPAAEAPGPAVVDLAAAAAAQAASAAPPPEPLPPPLAAAPMPAPAASTAVDSQSPAALAGAGQPDAVARIASLPPALAAAAASAAAERFAWPPSTRLNYRLQGNYRGPVDGNASVEWLREGNRYQVRMHTAIGPVVSRQITSEGELTPQGLVPRRFDGEQKVMFRAPRRWSLRFGPDEVQLANGSIVPAQPGQQDEASQFIQLIWLFTTRPERLKVGQSVQMPLAITRRLEGWTYDVVREETLRLPAPLGETPTFHLKPRRDASGGDLTAEIWVAPTLQYLPVRILIRDTGDNFADLTLERSPLQARE